MSVRAVVESPVTVPRVHIWGRTLVLAAIAVVALGFVLAFAVPYIVPDARRQALYATRRVWLIMHIAGGTATLLAGPVQLWLGLGRRYLTLHRYLGRVYVFAVAVGSVSAFYLASHTPLGWVFGMGLTCLGVAWVVTTGMALFGIRRGLTVQHQEWMIRSYTVTFAFVTFRALVGVLEAAEVGTAAERLAAASWCCWAAPLLAVEAVIQGRAIGAVRNSGSRTRATQPGN